MHRSLRQTEEEEDPQLSIDSLIDVAFLLLIYFLVTTTLQEMEADLEIRVPSPPPETASKIPPVPPMPIKIMANGDIVLSYGLPEQESLDLGTSGRKVPLLRQRLEVYQSSARLQPDQNPIVIIDPDSAVESQRFVDVVNQVVAVGIKDVSFTVFSADE